MFDPDVIVFGGSVSESLVYVQEIIAPIMKERKVKLLKSNLGDLAALYGAAMLDIFELINGGTTNTKARRECCWSIGVMES